MEVRKGEGTGCRQEKDLEGGVEVRRRRVMSARLRVLHQVLSSTIPGGRGGGG